MFYALTALVLIAALSILLAGLLALVRSPRKKLNRSFFVFSLSLSLWSIFNFLGSNLISETWTETFVKLDYYFATLIVWSLVYFLSSYNENTYISKKATSNRVMVASLVYFVVLAVLLFLNLIVTVGVEEGSLLISEEIFYPLYITVLFGLVFVSFLMFYKAFHHSRMRQRSELSFILVGTIVAVILNMLTNLVFPVIYSSRETIQLLNIIGYIGLVFFAVSIYMSITIKRLFDIRLVIARSLGYFLATAIIAISYGLISVLLSNSITANNPILDGVLQAIIVTIAAVSYAPLKKWLDEVTNKVFYRDAYDPQFLIDRLSDLLVSTLDLGTLMRGSAQMIASNMKLNFVQFVLVDSSKAIYRSVSTISTNEVNIKMLELAHSTKMGMVLAEEHDLEDPIRILLDQGGAGAIVKLVLPKESGLKGYLVLGFKNSGNSYTRQDLKTFQTLSKELTIATQNALQFAQIQSFNLVLEDKIDNATKQLKRSNEKLKALDEAKDDFVSMASHQLRTPLTSVKGYLSMVLEGDAGDITEPQRMMLGQAFTSSQRMTYLIADLLNLSRLKTGKFVIENAPVKLASVIAQEASQVQATAEARSLTIAYDEPQDFPVLLLDETKIRQVIMNFLDNAIYYTPAGGEITVKLEQTEKSIEFTVHDTGIGVPVADQHNLFTKFYRAANARQARPDGTGLGLFMARKVIVAQGGAIIFRSQTGKGSTFGFSFPKEHVVQQITKTT